VVVVVVVVIVIGWDPNNRKRYNSKSSIEPAGSPSGPLGLGGEGMGALLLLSFLEGKDGGVD
jgi:hypothetical protein